MFTFFFVTAIVIFIIGLAKGGFGGTLGALATPLMALVMPADQVIGLLLPILMIADVFAVASHWQRWDSRLVMWLIPGAILGTAIASLFIANVSAEALQRGIGLVVLLFVLYRIFGERLVGKLTYRARNWHGLVAGSIGGFTSTLAHTGGPPISVYLLLQNTQPRVFVATSALFFTVLNWIKVPSYLYLDLFDLAQLWQVIWLLPLLPLGVWIGKIISEKVNKVIFDWSIIIILGATALLLLLR